MYDVCIVGGGINGVSTALQCSQKGLKVVLFEQRELANGASSKTSKLAHGGLRYLENLEFGLVKESLQERNRLIDEYPDIVKPQPFIFPIYTSFDTVKMWMGLKLYDRLAKGTQMPSSSKISAMDSKIKVPWLKINNIKSVFLYYDAVMNDKKMVERIAEKAKRCSTDLFCNEKVLHYEQLPNYVEIETSKHTVQSKTIVNVTGAWNKEHTTPSKGVHLITNKLKSNTATILINPDDKRVFFTVPYNDQTIIGTTDNIYDGDPDRVTIEQSDREYIINAINKFSICKLTLDDITDEYVGLRPLAKSDKDAGNISRDFQIKQTGRVFSMVGGKYTTHRSMCENLTCQIEQFLIK